MKNVSFLLFLAIVSCCCNIFAQNESAGSTINPRDKLSISVEGAQDLDKTAVVSERGTIRFPLLGDVQVAGLTATDASKKMEQLLKQYYFLDSTVSVTVQRNEQLSTEKDYQPLREADFSLATQNVSSLPSQEKKATSEEAQLPTYRIIAYDTLQISVYGEPDLSATLQVSEEGTIRYALLGEIKVGGLSATEVAKNIEELLKKGYIVNPQVSVSIEEHGKIYVFGEVVQPGSYELKGALTLVDVIVLAGGLKEDANSSKIKVIRTYRGTGEDKPIKDFVIDLESKGKDFYLYPLDKIIVDKYGKFFIVGPVRSPGAYKLERSDLTPLDAITFLAGGANDNANLSAAVIVRNENGEKKEYVFDLLKKEDPDFFLKEEDRIILKPYKDVSVFGQVRRTGTYPYRRGMTTTEVISLAGGFTDVADTNGVKIIRESEKKKKAIKVPVGYILKTGDKSRDVELKDGDTVVVPESWL